MLAKAFQEVVTLLYLSDSLNSHSHGHGAALQICVLGNNARSSRLPYEGTRGPRWKDLANHDIVAVTYDAAMLYKIFFAAQWF
jgi:hypothetical protein